MGSSAIAVNNFIIIIIITGVGKCHFNIICGITSSDGINRETVGERR